MYAMGGNGGGAVAERLYSVNLSTAATTFLAGPFSLEVDGEVIAYNYDDGHIYHWSGNGTALMEKINTTTFIATPVVQSGITHGEIFGAVYLGGGNFAVTDISSRALTISSAGAVSFVASNLPDDIRGLGYIDPILPVELTSFTSSINGRNVELNWTTSFETNNSGFEIERSLVNSVWSKVGRVNGNGTTTSSVNYSFTDKGLSTGNYNYRLKQIDFNGNFEYFNLSNEVIVGIPAKFDLSQNYPNPFNPSTTINYDLPIDGIVSIKLFDVSGKEVASIVNEVKTAGYYSVNFNAGNLSSGVYFYTITAGSFAETKKMALIR
ncbi:MAG: T9SS type A sorting domain-containing protein [Ignavibacteria bacterium]|nr:T9SS type A sorting domain-containing protein [Ignavibacteria bacterium]